MYRFPVTPMSACHFYYSVSSNRQHPQPPLHNGGDLGINHHPVQKDESSQTSSPVLIPTPSQVQLNAKLLNQLDESNESAIEIEMQDFQKL